MKEPICRWARNIWEIAYGALLWVCGLGTIQCFLKCTACGKLVENTPSARNWHNRTCPAINQ